VLIAAVALAGWCNDYVSSRSWFVSWRLFRCAWLIRPCAFAIGVLHPLVHVTFSDVDVGGEISVSAAIGALELRVRAVFAFKQGSDAFVVPDVRAGGDEEGLAGLEDVSMRIM
jgi:hypothetical protein